MGSPRALSADGTLARQLKRKWVWAGVVPGLFTERVQLGVQLKGKWV